MFKQVFAIEIELSIIEHRLTQLLESCQHKGIEFFYPSLIFNETYWNQSHDKREYILQNEQEVWRGEHPVQHSYFFVDFFLLDIVKSIRLTVYSYSKLKFKSLLELLKTKAKYSLTEFINPNTNEFYLKLNNFLQFEKTLDQNLVNVFTAKIYREFKEKKDFAVLFITLEQDFIFIEEIIKSIKKIDEVNKEQKLLTNIVITILAITDNFDESKFPHLYDLFKNKQVKLIKNIPKSSSFNLVITKNLFNNSKSQLLKFYNGSFYYPCIRGVYLDKNYPQNAAKVLDTLDAGKLEELSEINFDISKLKFESIYYKFQEKNIIDFLNKTFSKPPELITFSLEALNILAEAIKATKSGNEIYCYEEESQESFGIPITTTNNSISYIINTDVVEEIVNSLSDLDLIESNTFSVRDFISMYITESKKNIIFLSDLSHLFLIKPQFIESFFNSIKFTFREDLSAAYKKSRKYEFLKRFRIPLLGLSKTLYDIGFNVFKSRSSKNTILKEVFRNIQINSTSNSYKKVFEDGYKNFFLKKITSNPGTIINLLTISSSQKALLLELGIIPEDFQNFIIENKKNLDQFIAERIEPSILVFKRN